MDKSYIESVVRAFPKEDIAALNSDGVFFTVLQSGLYRELTDRLIDILKLNQEVTVKLSDICAFDEHFTNTVHYRQQIKWSPMVRCKDCKHRPSIMVGYDAKDIDDGFALEFPDERCPCQCSDPYYSWMPTDNWFCANGEEKDA